MGCGPFSTYVAETAVRALLYEVSVTPKPGLVDRANSGAHTDMDFFTFVDSALALNHYFEQTTRCGYSFSGPPEELLPVLRPLGLRAEQTMATATKGVNTHKGIIFSLGILCAALGHQKARGMASQPETLLDTAALICHNLCGEFDHLPHATKGTEAFQQHQATGIRGEMQAGLPHVRQIGYPVLSSLAKLGYPLNDASVIALLCLISRVEDTNIIGRGGLGALRSLRRQITAAIADHPLPNTPFEAANPAYRQLMAFAHQLDSQLIEENLSPGGSADLLAISLFVHFWFP